MKPLFMDVGDLLDAWKKAAKRNPNMPAEPPVQVSKTKRRLYPLFFFFALVRREEKRFLKYDTCNRKTRWRYPLHLPNCWMICPQIE